MWAIFVSLNKSRFLWLVWFGRVFGALELHFEPLGADLEPVHGGYRGLGGRAIVERHEPEALGQVRLFVYEHFGRNHGPEGQECRRQVRVVELLRQVVDEQVATFRT